MGTERRRYFAVVIGLMLVVGACSADVATESSAAPSTTALAAVSTTVPTTTSTTSTTLPVEESPTIEGKWKTGFGYYVTFEPDLTFKTGEIAGAPFDKGTYSLVDGRLTLRSAEDAEYCPLSSAEYEASFAEKGSRLELTPVHDDCGDRSRDLKFGLARLE